MSKLEDLQEWLEYLEKNYEDGIESAFDMATDNELETLNMGAIDGHINIEMVATTTDSESLAKEYGPNFAPYKFVTNGQLREKLVEARTMLDSYLRY